MRFWVSGFSALVIQDEASGFRERGVPREGGPRGVGEFWGTAKGAPLNPGRTICDPAPTEAQIK